ncbi:EpsG family protein [Flavobacterium dankookense]|uniref:EpsG-like putative glucosyltransferase n=1 Tax=Flavobacterium dankookense TaxID=706186 RepID=A0A4R6QA23_9FLAO|nr:EpsG family protein [Flavobacterium dankookense]TDP59191.1 EpsG-like putative glucosyltransferase [Flavobacterium dankookense]
MNTLVPIEYYTTIYYNILLFFMLFFFISTFREELTSKINLSTKNAFGIFLLVFVISYIGFRPIDPIFGDMTTYRDYLERYASGEDFLGNENDYIFQVFMRFCARNATHEIFFLLCAMLYIYPLYSASKNLFKEYWFYAFLMLVISFSFWGYAVNGIRNGIATTIFIYGISQKKRLLMFALIGISYLTHNAMMIPAAAFLIAISLDKTKWFLYGWLLCIPLSLVLGGSLELFFNDLVESERTVGYLSDTDEFSEQFSSTGFRWDFLLYSMSGVYAVWYFIIKQKFEDKTYSLICNTYLIANAFWILVIRASFSNRFAYLSWFLMGIVIIYPFLKRKFFSEQHKLMGRLIFVYFAFTYIMNILRGNN